MPAHSVQKKSKPSTSPRNRSARTERKGCDDRERKRMTPEYLYWLWIGGGAGFLVGIGLLAWARAADRKNYIIQRATPLPLSLINERDDVWLRGRAECDAPVVAPHFGTRCVYYSYKLEEHVRKTRRTKKGTETYYTWETRETSSEAALFRLRQDELSIEIDGAQAEFKDLKSQSERQGNWRHSLSYLPCPCEASAVGSVSEKKQRLEPHGNIPLIITPKTRGEFIKSAEFAERLMRSFGFFLFWAGAGTGFYGLFDYFGWPFKTAGRLRVETLLASAGAAIAVFLPVWALYVFNTFVTYRMRVRNAWRQIDVDMKMRYDLIPRLASAARGYMEHEKDVLERLTQLRGQAVAGDAETKKDVEGRVVDSLRRMAVIVEKYPDLKSQPLVERLMREMRAIEEKIAHGRTIYNEAVREYNENVQVFPRVLLARLGGFRHISYFEAIGPEREPPPLKS